MDSDSEYFPYGENTSDKSVASQQIPSKSHVMDLSFSTLLLDEINSSTSEKSVDPELIPSTSHIMTSSFTTKILDDINNFTSDKLVAPELIPSSSEINLSMNNVPMNTVSRNFSLVVGVEKSKKSNLTNKRIWDKLDHCLFMKLMLRTLQCTYLESIKTKLKFRNMKHYPKAQNKG